MDALDGNAIGGLLYEVFGTEMTDATGRCANCGWIGPLAETVVYVRAPGAVVRCRTCGSVLMVVIRHADMNGVDLSGLAALDAATAPLPA
jgi:phage FluMu protein Com